MEAEIGDHNGNRFVDGIDYLQWQRGESPKPLSRFDLAAWELNYRDALVGPLDAAITTPEPSTLLLASLASCVLLQRRRRF